MTENKKASNKIRNYYKPSAYNPRTFYDCGIAEFYEGYIEDALFDLNKALELGFNQGIVMGKLYYALAYITSNDLNDEINAIKYFSKAIEYCPTDPRLYYLRGHSYIDPTIKQFKEAIEDFDMAIKCANDTDITNSLQDMYYYRGYAKWKLGLNWKNDYNKANEPNEIQKKYCLHGTNIKSFKWDSYEDYEEAIKIN